jgi:hypothetical protein
MFLIHSNSRKGRAREAQTGSGAIIVGMRGIWWENAPYRGTLCVIRVGRVDTCAQLATKSMDHLKDRRGRAKGSLVEVREIPDSPEEWPIRPMRKTHRQACGSWTRGAPNISHDTGASFGRWKLSQRRSRSSLGTSSTLQLKAWKKLSFDARRQKENGR